MLLGRLRELLGAANAWFLLFELGLGVRAGLIVGPSFFLEARRHDKISRDLVTVGIRF